MNAFLRLLVDHLLVDLPWFLIGAGLGANLFFQWRIRRFQRELLANDVELLVNDRQFRASHAQLGEHLGNVIQMVTPELLALHAEVRVLRAELRTHTTSNLLHSPTDPPVNPEAVPPPRPAPRHARSPAPTPQEPREPTP